MAPRRKQPPQQQHEESSQPRLHEGTDQQAGPSAAASALPLLSLPHAVLAQHVWPLLSPWGRAQLHATCKEIRALADGLIDGTMHLHVTKELATALQQVASPVRTRRQHSSAQNRHGDDGSKQEVRDWHAKCALLTHCPRICSLNLELRAPLPPAAIQQLTAAAGNRMRSLSVDLDLLQQPDVHETFNWLPQLWPSLQQLHLSITIDKQPPTAAVVSAFQQLPATLKSLSLRLDASGRSEPAAATHFWPQVASALGSLTYLTQLHSLKVDFQWGLDVDVAPLAAIAASLTHLHLDWPGIEVSGLPQLLAACSNTLTSLALPVAGSAAPDHPSSSQILAIAPNLQQLEALADCFDGDADDFPTLQHSTQDDVRALCAHSCLRQLVVHSCSLRTQLEEADLQPGSLQHLQLELHLRLNSFYFAEDLLEVLEHVAPATRACKLVFEDGAGQMGLQLGSIVSDQLDADVLGSLANALRQPGVEISMKWDGFRDLPGDVACALQGACAVYAHGPINQPADQQAIAAVLGSLPGVHLVDDLLDIFYQEVQAVGKGQEAGIWLLPAFANATTLSLFPNSDSAPVPSGLPGALARGYLPQLQHLLLRCLSNTAADLVALFEVLKVRPGLKISTTKRLLCVYEISSLRAAVDSVPAPPVATSCGVVTRRAAAAAAQQERAVTLDDEGRRLLLERLLC